MENLRSSLGFIERVTITNDNNRIVSAIKARIQILEGGEVSFRNEAALASYYFAEGVSKLLTLPQSLYQEILTPSEYQR